MEKQVEEFLEEWIVPYIPKSRTTRAILIGSAVGLLVYYVTKKRYKLPPGPRAYPIVGNLLSFKGTNLYAKLKEWEEEYGPVMSIALGPMKCIVLNRIDVIQEAFVKKSADFAGRPSIFSSSMMTEGNKDIAFTDYGPTWQLHRRIALKALKSYMKGDHFVDLIGDVQELVIAEMMKEKEPFDIQKYVQICIFNILSKICFDEMFGPEDKEFLRFVECLKIVNAEFSTGILEDFIPILRICPTPKFRRVMRIYQDVLDFVYKRINHHRATFSEDVQRDFTDALLLAQKEAMTEENPKFAAEISDTHIGQTVSDVFQAGVDTSQQTLYWTILYIAAFPDIQAKMHRELDAVMGDRTRPSVSDREKLPYTEAVLYESMRLGSVSALTLPHTTTCDTTIGEFELPKGTMVLANLHAVHHDPKNWKDPQKFDPDRFLDASGKITKPETWIPFSLGKRACMAESLAKPELHLILAGLLKNIQILMPEGVQADIEPQDNSMLVQPKPYKIVIKRRG